MNLCGILVILVTSTLFGSKLVQGDRNNGGIVEEDGTARAEGERVAPGERRAGKGRSTPKPSVEMINHELDDKIKRQIGNKKGYYSNNTEYASNLKILSKVSAWPKEFYEVKQSFYDIFLQYDNRRLELEKNIDERLSALKSKLTSESPSVECLRFYLKQFIALQKLYRETNSLKENTLNKSNILCPYYPPSHSEQNVHDDDYTEWEEYIKYKN